MLSITTDILNIIYEYNPEHRPLFKECLKRILTFKLLKQIPKAGTFSRINHILNEFDESVFNGGEYDLEKLIRKHIPDPNFVIQNLHKCNCCTRHMTNKPKNLNDKLTLSGVAAPQMTRPPPFCTCNCRHFSRWIYRTFNNIIDENIPLSTKWVIQ